VRVLVLPSPIEATIREHITAEHVAAHGRGARDLDGREPVRRAEDARPREPTETLNAYGELFEQHERFVEHYGDAIQRAGRRFRIRGPSRQSRSKL
jgi:hypothetical protein